MQSKVDIQGLPKAKVLSALFNNVTHAICPKNTNLMTIEEAEQELENGTWFDYTDGRKMKLHFDSALLDVNEYDMNYIDGEAVLPAKDVISNLRAELS